MFLSADGSPPADAKYVWETTAKEKIIDFMDTDKQFDLLAPWDGESYYGRTKNKFVFINSRGDGSGFLNNPVTVLY